MSLVVARQVEGHICIVADSKVTDPRLSRPNHLQLLLKIIRISPGCAVAFAGSVDAAHHAITSLLARPVCTTHNEVSELLLQHHIEAERSVDFIVASLKPFGRITRIADGSMSTGNPAAWIGDSEAFCCFQEIFHRSIAQRIGGTDIPQSLSARSHWIPLQVAMSDALRHVVQTSQHPAVGGFVTRMQDIKGTFQYFGNARIELHGTSTPAQPTARLIPGSAADGSFTFVVLVTQPGEGTPAIGIHFHEAEIGLLLSPSHSLATIQIAGASLQGFIAEVEAKYHIILTGPQIG